MKCSKCQNNIEQKINCMICKNSFCSNNCMESHFVLSHKRKLLINIPFNNNPIYKKENYTQNTYENQIEIEKELESPYLVTGILNRKRKYDEKYNLKNFITIFENEKPKIIGGGSFGQVFLVMNSVNKKLYAIKHMSKKSLYEKLNTLDGIYKEIFIQSRIDHPNILPILYVKETNTDFHLVLEYASKGSLFQFIRKNKYLDEPLAFSLFIQVVNAIYFLHKNNLIHRDIKPENILLFENNVIKLCDFGWCVKIEEGQQRGTFCGTTEYMSPELVNHEEYSKEIDVWSLGILLYEMVHGYSPFRPDKPDFKPKDVIRNIRLHKLKFDENISNECKELIYHLLEENPDKRYKVEDIFNSDFVKFYQKRKFGLPDKYILEKYKYKLTKSHSCSYSKDQINNNYSYNNSNNKKNIPMSLSDVDLKCNKTYKKKLRKNNTTQYFHPLNIIENKITFSYLADSNTKNNSQIKNVPKYNNNENKENINNNGPISKNETKIKTIIINNYFPEILKSDNNNNIYNYTNNNTNNNTNNVTNNYNNNYINNNTNNNNIQKSNTIQNNNIDKKMQPLPYKKTFHIKPLKMTKIPINTKMGNHLLSPSSRINTLLDSNYLIIKKHFSPKIPLNTENIKTNSFQLKKNNENNDPKIIEVNKNQHCKSPKIYNLIPAPNMNRNNFIKKSYTRNNINNNTYYENSRVNNNSEINLTNTNIEGNSHRNNNCSSNYLITSNEDSLKKKIIDTKSYTNKPLNQLKRNFSNENIKSIFISNIKNEINSLNYNTIYNENKSASNQNTLHIKRKNLNLNLNDIKKINTTVSSTKANTPLNTFNNNFIYTIFNNNKKENNDNNNNKNDNKNNIRIRNNISANNSYIYRININNNNTNSKLNILNKDELNCLIFPKIKVHKTNIYTQANSNNNCEQISKSNRKINLDKIIDNNKINNKNINNLGNNNFYDKCTKLLNSMSHTSIFQPNKNNKKEHKKNVSINYKAEIDKKIKTIPKRKSFKKNEKLNININLNNKRKNGCLEKCRCNSNRIINNKKILSIEVEKEKINTNKKNNNINNIYKLKDNITNKIRNNSYKGNTNNDLKYKIIKKLDLNEFLNNINKDYKNYNLMTTSSNKSEIGKINRINTSLNNKNYYEILENSKRKYNNELDNIDNKNSKSTKTSLGSRNFEKYKIQLPSENIKYQKFTNINGNNKENKENKSLNICGGGITGGEYKILNKKDNKIIFSPKLLKKNEIKNEKKFLLNNNENKNKNNIRYNQIDYKGINNGIFFDKYKFYKKDNYNNYNDENYNENI